MPAPVRLLSDDALVRAVRSGSDDAFAEIVRRHEPRLHRQCRRLVGPDRADDAVQQTLASAMVALRRGDDARAIDLDRWLGRIARNASIDLLRRATPDWAELDERIDGVRRPPQVAADRERLRATVADIQDLPERQRRAIVLHAFEGRSWGEIGTELDVGEPAVRQLLHRARTRLRSVAAGLIGPFWLLRPAGARAAGLLAGAAGGGGMKAAGGLAVALVVAGGTVVEVTSPSHQGRVRAALSVADAAAAPATAQVAADAVVVDDGAGDAAARAPRLRVHRAHRPAASHRWVAPRLAQIRVTPGRRTRSHARHQNSSQEQAQPVTEPSPAPSAPVSPTTTTTEPAPAAPAPAAATAPDSPAPDPAPAIPAGPPPPAAIGHIVQWIPGTGSGGQLRIEGLPTGNETAWVGELTVMSCVHVEGGVVVASGACSPAEIAVGGQVSVADRAFNATAGLLVWTRLELLR